MRAFLSIAFSLILFSCSPPETEAERINRELNEIMEKLNNKLEEGNKRVEEKTKEAQDKLDKFEKEIGNPIHIEKINSNDLKKTHFIQNGDTIRLKIDSNNSIRYY